MKLIGPFPATTTPVRNGVYKVCTPSASPNNKYSYWSKQKGWRLCSSTIKSAEGELYVDGWYGCSSMYTAGATWWGLAKESV